MCAELGNVGGYEIFKPSDRCDARVRMYTLGSLIREFGVGGGAVLKMDCEGCEYEAILKAYSGDLAVFGQVVIEYHNGYESLRKKLESAGFETTIKPIRSVKIPIERQGYIIAKQRA